MFSKVILLIYISAYDSFRCTTFLSLLEIVRHFHFCQSKVENIISQAEHHALVASTWGQGGPQLHGGQQRSSQCQPPRIEVQILLSIACGYQSHQGKHNIVKHWMNNKPYTHIKKKQSKMNSNSVPHGQGMPSLARKGQLAYMHFSYTTVEGLSPLTGGV